MVEERTLVGRLAEAMIETGIRLRHVRSVGRHDETVILMELKVTMILEIIQILPMLKRHQGQSWIETVLAIMRCKLLWAIASALSVVILFYKPSEPSTVSLRKKKG